MIVNECICGDGDRRGLCVEDGMAVFLYSSRQLREEPTMLTELLNGSKSRHTLSRVGLRLTRHVWLDYWCTRN
jgi:hypothetical protein